LIAQAWISISFKKYSNLSSGSNITGEQAARIIKEGEGYSVDIIVQGESLSDHFDPSKNIVSISKASLEDSVASVAVVAHEFGHVQQKYNNLFLFNLRTALVPIVNIGSRLGYILIIVGLILNILGLAEIGLILFALTTVFALVTLPIEIDASKRAFKFIRKYNLIQESRIGGAKSILSAAATTYIAALLTSLLNVLYYASLIRRRS
ncbi:MAG: zinc metallopeptidase, partial [Candidatus Dojkabacteria bacterium]|nr:zinc metallopeptidase [Candidatus Dojkabacteria bacterium]